MFQQRIVYIFATLLCFSHTLKETTMVEIPETTPASAEHEPTYEELLQMRGFLQNSLLQNTSRLRGNSFKHAAPGGSHVVKDESTGSYYLETDVQIVVSISRIDSMNVDSQTLIFAAEIATAWIDSNLAWSFETIPLFNVVMDEHDLWTPRLLPRDLIGYDYIPSSLKKSVTVFYTGAVIEKVTATITAPCNVQVLTYPFDTHHCHFRLTQMFDPGERMNIIAVPMSNNADDLFFATQHKHREWDLIFLNSLKEIDGDYSGYHLEVVLRRKATFYAIVLILPCIVLNFLSFLMFVVDVESTGRVDLALNLILSFFVLLIILVDSLPPSGDDVPLLGLYVTVSTLIVVFTMTGSLVMIGLNRKKVEGKPFPKICNCIATKIRFPCFRQSDPYEVKNNNTDSDVQKEMLQDRAKNEVNKADESNDHKYNLAIENINFALFLITLIIHLAILLGVAVVWRQKTL